MRIAHVHKRYGPSVGGTEVHIEALAGAMVAMGHEVEVLTHDHTGSLAPVEEIDGVTVRRFRQLLPADHFDVSRQLWRHLAASGDRYDVVHAHNYHSSPPLVVARTWHGPWVFSPYYHGTGHSSLRAAAHVGYRRLASSMFDRTDQIVCLTEGEADGVRAAYPSTTGRITMVPAPVDVDEIRAARPMPGSAKTIFTAGRLVDYKRVDRIISALALTSPDWRLRIAGDGPARGGLEQLARRLGVADRVDFLGFVERDELVRWYRTAAVVVSVSEHESQGISLVEGLAAGVPAVASNIEAHVGVIEMTGGSVTLVEPDLAPEDLAHVLTTRSPLVTPPHFLPTPEHSARLLVETYAAAIARHRAPIGADATASDPVIEPVA